MQRYASIWMTAVISTVNTFIMCATATAQPAAANELRDLQVLKSFGGRLNVDLTAKEQAVPFTWGTGTNKVTVTPTLKTYNGRFAPTVWQLYGGDVVRVLLQNNLCPSGNCNDHKDPNDSSKNTHTITNLHVHGLEVSPQRNGDNMAVQVLPKGDAGGAHDHGGLTPVAAKQRFVYELRLPPKHPPGLNWFHPHVHGNSLEQIGNGMSGLIAVGQSSRTLKYERVRYMALRDLQLADNKPLFPQDLKMCDGLRGQGLCTRGTNATGPTNRWLFPINDQIYPTITMAPGKKELWRIANTSANVTYKLSLGATELCIVGADGIYLKDKPGRACPGELRKSIIVMPAARFELLVDAPTTGGAPLILKTDVFATGAADIGDTFPAIDLAVIQSGRTRTAAAPQASNLDRKRLATALSANPAFPVPEVCVPTYADDRKFERRYITLNVDEAIPPATHVPNTYDFQIGAGIIKEGANRQPLAGTQRPVPVGYGKPNSPTTPAICIKKDSKEIWRIENHSGELHNFHIHQLKFKVLAICYGTKDGKCNEIADEESLRCGQATPGSPRAITAARVRSSAGSMMTRRTPADGRRRSREEVYDDDDFVMHDTVAVPCASYSGSMVDKIGGTWEAKDPGYTLIEVDFDKPEHIGSYIFHCHIMEHQERGMMARIVVQP
jgi:FtsP/CotA-like multicopper oxidase with cupredoxin domain